MESFPNSRSATVAGAMEKRTTLSTRINDQVKHLQLMCDDIEATLCRIAPRPATPQDVGANKIVPTELPLTLSVEQLEMVTERVRRIAQELHHIA